MPKFQISNQEANDVVNEEHDDWEIISNEPVEQDRWTVTYAVILKHKPTGKFYSDSYRRGATEDQECDPYDGWDPDFDEVEPYEKTVVDYRPVEDKKEHIKDD